MMLRHCLAVRNVETHSLSATPAPRFTHAAAMVVLSRQAAGYASNRDADRKPRQGVAAGRLGRWDVTGGTGWRRQAP